MPHLRALGFNPQKLIDVLVLMNGNDVYKCIVSALKVEKSTKVSHMHPSPNALISQITNELSKSPEHHLAISDIKSDSIIFVR